jgi:predicted membrane protein
LRDDINLTLTAGFAYCLVQVGGTIGSIAAGAFVKYGKKNFIHVSNFITVLGFSLIASSGPFNTYDRYPVNKTSYLP